ncbi:MAG: glycosyltransferase family 2 protein [Cellvibrionaceae bacterium]|nr:glycosyltransferase family 2 protein [Cellvibrionaceae bacterium]
MKELDAALLITTYNWPEALQQVLRSVAAQTRLPKEVVIADDGSQPETRALINDALTTFPTTLIHCWHRDQGFRAAAIRNRAIAKITAPYVIMIDGDMVLHPQFISDHLDSAQPGYFIQGSRVITGPAAAARLLSGERLTVFSRDLGNRINALNCPILSRCLSQKNHHRHGTRTCNFSVWRDDLLTINGFNEDYIGWGREDSDLVARLLHSGRQRIKLKCLANAYHIFHRENNRQRLSANDALLAQCLADRQIRCENGIEKPMSQSVTSW